MSNWIERERGMSYWREREGDELLEREREREGDELLEREGERGG